MTPATQKIIEILVLQQENNAACYSYVGHAIFDDYNLGTGQYLYESATNHTRWKAYIDDQYADMLRENRADSDFGILLCDVTDAIDALMALCLFSDEELSAAEDYLHENGLPRP
jgi:hypothetical protein